MSDLNGFRFSESDIKRVLGTPEGKRLLQLLSRDGGALLRQAAEAVKSGNSEHAQQVLRPLMETPEAEKLIQKLNRE